MVSFVFTYGTLVEHDIMHQVTRNAKEVDVDRIMGLTLRSCFYLTAAKGKDDDFIYGLVWEVDDMDLRRLDNYESCPSLYTRELCKTVGDRDVWCYFMTDTYIEHMVPRDQHSTARRGYIAAGIPETQIDEACKRKPKAG